MVAVQDGLGPQVAVAVAGARPEVSVQVCAVDVVECFDVAHFGSGREMKDLGVAGLLRDWTAGLLEGGWCGPGVMNIASFAGGWLPKRHLCLKGFFGAYMQNW